MTERIADITSPDRPSAVSAYGGRQSDIPVRFDLVDAHAMFVLAGILHHGAEKYGVDNWRAIETESQLNHALTHIYAWLDGDRGVDHLGHAFCRMMFAVGVDAQGGPLSKADVGVREVWAHLFERDPLGSIACIRCGFGQNDPMHRHRFRAGVQHDICDWCHSPSAAAPHVSLTEATQPHPFLAGGGPGRTDPVGICVYCGNPRAASVHADSVPNYELHLSVPPVD